MDKGRYPIIIEYEAEKEIETSFLWYQERLLGLGHEFLFSLNQTLLKIQNSPEAFSVVLRDIRKLRVRRFPYNIYYTFRDDKITILSVFHFRRSSKDLKI